MRDALQKAGLITEQKRREADAAEELDAQMAAGKLARAAREKEKRLAILNGSSSVDSFRREARRLLLANPNLVQQILNIAHERGMQKKRDKGGGRLIANLYQVREALQQSGLNADEQREAVERLFPNK